MYLNTHRKSCQHLKSVLITTASSEKINSMTIAWGMFGIEWENLYSLLLSGNI